MFLQWHAFKNNGFLWEIDVVTEDNDKKSFTT